MRTVAAASLLVFALVAIVMYDGGSRNMFAPAYAPTMTSAQMASIYSSPAFAPVENVQYVQPAFTQHFAAPPVYMQPVEPVAEGSSGSTAAWAYAAAGAILVGAAFSARWNSAPAGVAVADIESATSAARVATLAVSGRRQPAPKKGGKFTNASAQQRIAEKALNNPMNFDGWLPETVNGRLAQVGFVAAIYDEITTKQMLVEQFQNNFDAFAVTAILVMLGSVAPSVQRTLTADYDESGARLAEQEEGAKDKLLALFKAKPKPAAAKYTSDPKTIALSEDPFGVFKYDSEVANNRGAMIGIAAMLATEYLTQQPLFMLAVDGEEVSADKKDKAENRSGLKGVEAMEARADQNPMNFNSWAPEVINGRLAQLGFVAAVQSEISTGQTLAQQFQNNFGAFAASVVLVTVASFAPSLQQAIIKDLPESKSVGYASDPKTIAPTEDPFGVFKASSEMTNSRAAMVGIAAMLATELAINRPIFMLGVDGKEAAELEASHAKLRSWADRAGARLLADKRTVALLGLGGSDIDAQDAEPAINPELTASMAFSGWAPEVINGRLAQLGFIAALGTEALNPGEKLADQFVDNFPLFAGSVLAVVVASFAPEVYRQNVGEKKVEYTADPKSIDPKKDPFGVFSVSSEMTNSRAAMVGIAAMLITEQLLQRPLIMFGVEGKEATRADAELNERLNAWAEDAGADLLADEDKVAMLFLSGRAAPKKAPASGGLFSAFAKGGASVKKSKGPLYGTGTRAPALRL
jgi:uncharacterized membrane protein